MSKAGYDFDSTSNLGKNNANTVNDKERNLTKTQKKLKEHGYGVDNIKVGLGFTPNTLVKISSKAKSTSAQYISMSVEHISMSVEQDQEELKPTPQISVFERLSKPKKQSNTASSPLQRSDLERLDETKKSSRKRKTTPKEEKPNGLAEKDDVGSMILSRMKRKATLEVDTKRQLTLEVDTKRQLKVKRRTIIHTG
ncbi:hypothetical protein TB2_027354 [Malus domestica]